MHGGEKEVFCDHHLCLNMGGGYQTNLVLGPVVWEDCKFGSGLSSVLCESSFSL